MTPPPPAATNGPNRIPPDANRRDANLMDKGKTHPVFLYGGILVLAGLAGFLLLIGFGRPERAWQIYLVNFLFWSAVAQGGLLFSMIMHVTKARWSGAMQNLSETFAAFFPISLVAFLILFFGRGHLFPWLHEDIGARAVWLNLPFLFARDLVGLLVLYGLGIAYVRYAFRAKVAAGKTGGALRFLVGRTADAEACRVGMTRTAIAYMFAYGAVLSLISFDLVMSMDPHFVSTLFGGYFFVKAVFLGLGALIVVAAAVSLALGARSQLTPAHFHDTGKLFFAFTIVWAYFLYAQVLVIWYGNVPEETHYLLRRFEYAGWKFALVAAFVLAFVIPFFVLLNERAKKTPILMLAVCSLALAGIWLENLLLIGPPLHYDTGALALRVFDVLVSLGFLGLMAMAIAASLRAFPELIYKSEEKVAQ